MEIEINFRFDEHGRTANTKVNGETNGENTSELDYGFKAEMTDLKEWSKPESSSSVTKTRLDEILLDCEISDNLIMPRTYWMPADGSIQPRCALEQFALDVFEHHVPRQGFDYDPETSGAEWWCQLRPSPETGRHRAVQQQKSCGEEEEDAFTNGISFHVDKDEELRILTGGSTYVHPHLSTITYLTNLGSPTLIMDCQVHPLTGEWMVPEESVEGFVSWPSVGKHTSFDGRYLHASPLDLMGDEDAFPKQLKAAQARMASEGAELSKTQKRRCRRVTFLVNIWLNYKPYDVNPYPESMLDKMSGRDEKQRRSLAFGKKTSASLRIQETCVQSGKATETSSSKNDDAYTAQAFSWPLGDKRSGEKLDCNVPLKSIVAASNDGSNVRIQWQRKTSDDCFVLFDGKSTTEVSTENDEANMEVVSQEESQSKPHHETIPSEEQSSKRPRID